MPLALMHLAMVVDAWAQTHIGLVRRSNQDAVGCFRDVGLFLVADGMGGHADGELASQTAIAVVADQLNPASWRRGHGVWAALRGLLAGRAESASSGAEPPLQDLA